MATTITAAVTPFQQIHRRHNHEAIGVEIIVDTFDELLGFAQRVKPEMRPGPPLASVGSAGMVRHTSSGYLPSKQP